MEKPLVHCSQSGRPEFAAFPSRFCASPLFGEKIHLPACPPVHTHTHTPSLSLRRDHHSITYPFIDGVLADHPLHKIEPYTLRQMVVLLTTLPQLPTERRFAVPQTKEHGRPQAHHDSEQHLAKTVVRHAVNFFAAVHFGAALVHVNINASSVHTHTHLVI
jgi:hypothetical protein